MPRGTVFAAVGLLLSLFLASAQPPSQPAGFTQSPPGTANRDEAGERANKEYQLGRKHFEAGDLAAAEPHFLKAAEAAPHYPEPHYALAQIMVRQGRHQEAQARMALAQKNMPPGTQGANAAAPATTVGNPDESLAVVAAKTSASLPPSYQQVGRALSHIAGYLVDGQNAVATMAASSDPQDQHNARIHHTQHVAAEDVFRRLALAPTDANLWWQLALHSFNQRRDHMTASVAFAVTAQLSNAPMVLMSFYLLYHAWQHLCDWRDWDSRLQMLAARIHASLGDTVQPDTAGPGKKTIWIINEKTAIGGSGGVSVGGGAVAEASEDGGGGWLFGSSSSSSKGSKEAKGKEAAATADDGGGKLRETGQQASASELESLAMAMESPYIFLVTRLTDTDPILIRRLFARQAWLQQRSLDQIAAPAPPSMPPPIPGETAPSAAGDDDGALEPLRSASDYTSSGQLGIGYLSGLPAGHVTYNLVGSMLKFHNDKHLKVHWCTAAAEPAPIREGRGGGLRQHHPHLIELNGLSPHNQAKRLREAKIGVLIDLDGWIGDEPPRRLMAASPAPIRSVWLGWAGTTADPSIQYKVSDAITTPPQNHHLQFYSEKLLLLPRAYQLNDHNQLYPHIVSLPAPSARGAAAAADDDGDGAPPPPPGRAPIASGIDGVQARGGGRRGGGFRQPKFTLANFNQLMKVTPDMFSVWSGAMLRTPGVQLLLLTGVTNVHVQYPSTSRNLDGEMAVRGLRLDRLSRGPVRAKDQHLERAARCDLAVDTLSYNSHTTGSDSLWSGLPLLSQSGRYFAARVGSSLIHSAGMPMMQVHSLKQYEDNIHMLATRSKERARTKGAGMLKVPPWQEAPPPEYTVFGTRVLFGAGAPAPPRLDPNTGLAAEPIRQSIEDLVGPRPWWMNSQPSLGRG